MVSCKACEISQRGICPVKVETPQLRSAAEIWDSFKILLTIHVVESRFNDFFLNLKFLRIED